MRTFLFITIANIFCFNCLIGQTWQSISKIGTFQTPPFRNFKIDGYTNNIWLIHDTKVAVIENNGNIQVFTNTELGPLWNGDNIQFAFTPSNIYYNINLYGFHSFTGYSSTLIEASFQDYLNMTSNYDTVYVTMADGSGFRKFYNGTVESYNRGFTKIDAKGSFVYGNNGGSVIYQYIQAIDDAINLTSDPQYLWYIYNDTKFSRNTDTFYVGSTKGISYAYNYDFLDTITPNNTFNMPSPNVLELEFDAQDSLWAVFGDVNNDPFAIAKLEGNTWTNRIDNTNSPIDFSTFLGLEIDTLGNLWVADLNYLHTLLTPNSPQWLSLIENEVISNLSLSPNPSSEQITIKSQQQIDEVQIVDLQGRIVYSTLCNSMNPSININELKPGNYFVNVTSGLKSEYLKFIKH